MSALADRQLRLRVEVVWKRGCIAVAGTGGSAISCKNRIWRGELALSGFVRFVARMDAGIGVSKVMRP